MPGRGRSPVDAALALQVLHAGGRIPHHLQQRLHSQAGSLGPQEGQEVSPWSGAALSLLGSGTQLAEFPLRDGPPLTLHQLHDDVDGLLLGADANESHDVGVAVLLQDPGRRRCSAPHSPSLLPSRSPKEDARGASESGDNSPASEAISPGRVTGCNPGSLGSVGTGLGGFDTSTSVERFMLGHVPRNLWSGTWSS